MYTTGGGIYRRDCILYIEGMDQPTVLHILYTMVSAQQMNLLPKNTSQNDAIFARSLCRRYGTTSQCI